MLTAFLQTAGTTLLSMTKLFMVMLLAGVLVRRRVLTPAHIQGLTAATVDVFLPCMTFSSILTAFRPEAFGIWWLLPLAAAVMMLAGIGLGAILFRSALPAKRNMLPLTGIHNAAYLILPLGAVLFPDRFDVFSLYVFLFVMGQTPIIWSLGKFMTTAGPDARFRWRDVLNPPMAASLAALLLVFTGIRDLLLPAAPGDGFFPARSVFTLLLDTATLIGDATVPVALFILGGVLGGIHIRLRPYLKDSLKVVCVKFLMIPSATLAFILAAGIDHSHPFLATFLMIQSTAPPAIVIILQINKYGGDEQKIGSMLLFTYLLCLVAMPSWMALWHGIGAP